MVFPRTAHQAEELENLLKITIKWILLQFVRYSDEDLVKEL